MRCATPDNQPEPFFLKERIHEIRRAFPDRLRPWPSPAPRTRSRLKSPARTFCLSSTLDRAEVNKPWLPDAEQRGAGQAARPESKKDRTQPGLIARLAASPTWSCRALGRSRPVGDQAHFHNYHDHGGEGSGQEDFSSSPAGSRPRRGRGCRCKADYSTCARHRRLQQRRRMRTKHAMDNRQRAGRGDGLPRAWPANTQVPGGRQQDTTTSPGAQQCVSRPGGPGGGRGDQDGHSHLRAGVVGSRHGR